MSIINFENITEEHSGYLRDESRKSGSADTISFPSSIKEISDIMSQMYKNKIKVTLQGARTGITGGAVPVGGHILSLSRMDKVMGMRFDDTKKCFILRVQPGLELLKLRGMLEKKEFDTQGWTNESLEALVSFKKPGKFFFPPDPTETSASIGGMVACNASGARSFLYGPTRNYVESLKIVLADGSLAILKRREDKASGKKFSIAAIDGRVFEGKLPEYKMPLVKNASGYFSAEGMDLVDLFIGSEGTLGAFGEIEIILLPLPECIWGITTFFNVEAEALKFVRTIRGDFESNVNKNFRPAAIEFFNGNALELLRNMKKSNPAFKSILNIPDSACTAIYIEYHGSSREELFKMAEAAEKILIDCGGDAELTWVAATEKDMERLHFFRHAVPEAVNLTIDARRKTVPGLTKLGTDMAVPDFGLEEVVNMYNNGVEQAGLDSVIFGHIGNNHVHVNILPRSMEEYDTGKRMYQAWAKKVISMGGTVSAEHGIGKMKTALLSEMYGEKGIDGMLQVKKVFDPGLLLNTGNLFM